MKCLLFPFILLPLLSAEEDGKTLRTIPQGQLRGTSMTTRSGKTFYAFKKIPYATPPLGELRFKLPQKAENWEGIRDATEDPPICTQRNVFIKDNFFLSGQEDCLYLNVYTPEANRTGSELRAVMVWFHGGGFVTGSGNSYYYPPHYLLDKDIVLVGVNYRVGPIGFLSMEDDVLPGNWGLKDQSFALRWVRDNIQNFGGDPNLVTIFGESAGGTSVHYHMLSPMSRGLFHRAISQSGTALTSWSMALPGATRNNTIKMAKLLGCPTAPTLELVQCLREKPAEDIITQDIQFMEWFFDPMTPFKPTIESLAPLGEAFLSEHPEDTIKARNFADVPWMTGLTSGDGALRVAAIFNKEELVQDLNNNFETVAPITLFYRGKVADVDGLSRRIRKFYFGDKPIGNETRMDAVDLWTDAWFLAGEEKAVHLHRTYSSAPIYYYYFSYRGSASFSALFGDETRDYGVCHADDLIYLFPQEKPFPNHTYTDDDIKFQDILPQLWTDFAKYGNPTPEGGALSNRWTAVKTESLEYFHIAGDKLEMESNMLPERSAFWSSINFNTRRRPTQQVDEQGNRLLSLGTKQV